MIQKTWRLYAGVSVVWLIVTLIIISTSFNPWWLAPVASLGVATLAAVVAWDNYPDTVESLTGATG